MAVDEEVNRAIIDRDKLPAQWPTHRHAPEFWEQLGRTVATFGHLEEVLGRAIFAFTATKEYSEEAIAEALEKLLPRLEKALSDPLGNLIDVYAKSVREHQGATIENLPELVAYLRKAAEMRNVLCHGSWRIPNAEGASVPRFVNRQMMIFETAVDIPFLEQTQAHVAELACAVVNTVTHMGYQFPGGAGPGKPIWTRE